MDKELKPCPFCAGEAKIDTKGLSEVFAYADQVTVKCLDCGRSRFATGDMSKGGYADNSKCEQQAIDKWNTRTEPGWISVDERLPIDGPDEMEMQYEEVEVIATDGVDVFCCSFQFGKTVGFWSETFNATHWMPLPEPPEE